MPLTKEEEAILISLSAGVLAILRDIRTEGHYYLNCEFYKGTGPAGSELFLKNISVEREKKLD